MALEPAGYKPDTLLTVFGGPGPATYRSTEAPVAIGFRRGARDTYAEYESPTLHRKQAWCMHVTRGSTRRLADGLGAKCPWQLAAWLGA